VKRRSQLIGVILFTGFDHPDIGHPFFQEVLVGLKNGIGAHGYDLLLFATEQSRGDYVRRARQHRVDGIVLMGVDVRDPGIEPLFDAGIPVLAVDIDISGARASYVTSDNVGGARLAVRHLRDLGHTRIATIAGPADSKPGADRLLGFRAELRQLGLDARGDYEEAGDYYHASGEAAMRRLLALREPPTAVFAASDMMAVGAIKAVHDAGLDVPGNVAIVGFDDIQLATHVQPNLTTIRQDKLGLGLAVTRALVEQIDNPDVTPPVLTLPVELVVRASSDGRKEVRHDHPHTQAGIHESFKGEEDE
jgi:LacI family transcriptional regulator